MAKHTAMVTMEGEYDTVRNFQLVPFSMTFSDL